MKKSLGEMMLEASNSPGFERMTPEEKSDLADRLIRESIQPDPLPPKAP
jgi:hypothetical protein